MNDKTESLPLLILWVCVLDNLLQSYMGTEKKLSLSFELSHEFELNTKTQNSPIMSYSTKNSDSKDFNYCFSNTDTFTTQPIILIIMFNYAKYSKICSCLSNIWSTSSKESSSRFLNKWEIRNQWYSCR